MDFKPTTSQSRQRNIGRREEMGHWDNRPFLRSLEVGWGLLFLDSKNAAFRVRTIITLLAHFLNQNALPKRKHLGKWERSQRGKHSVGWNQFF